MPRTQRYISLLLSIFLVSAGIRMLSAHGWYDAQLMYIIGASLLFVDATIYALSILIPYKKSKFFVYLYLFFIMGNLVATITDQVGLVDSLFFAINLYLGYLHIKSNMK